MPKQFSDDQAEVLADFLSDDSDGIEFDNDPSQQDDHLFDDDDDDDIPAGNKVKNEKGSNDDDDDDDDLTTGLVDDKNQQRQQPQDDQTQQNNQNDNDDDLDGLDVYGRFDEDNYGNLMYNGRVLVKKGRPRMVFDKLRKELRTQAGQTQGALRQLNELATNTKKLYEKYKELNEAGTAAKRYNLSDDQANEALQLFALSMTDPKLAIRKVLTKAQMNGTDLSDLGITGPVDAEEVARHTMRLQEEARRKAEQQQQTTEPVVSPQEQEAKDFLIRNPQALAHVEAIGNARNKFPHLSFDQIWTGLQQHLQQKNQNNDRQDRQQTRQGTRPHTRDQRRQSKAPPKKGKLDLSARDASQSFEDIGAELLRDIKAIEER